MSNSQSFFVVDSVAWLTRLASGPATRRLLLSDPVVFASWYVLAEPAIDWPQAVCDIQQQQRSRQMRLEQTMKLVAQLSLNMPGQPSARRARSLLEGHAVGEWAARNVQTFIEAIETAAQRAERLVRATDLPLDDHSGPAKRLAEIERALSLPPLQTALLRFAVTCTISTEVASLMAQFSESRWTADALWTTVFACTRADLEAALRPDSALRLSGLLRLSHHRGAPVALSEFWVGLLASSDNLFDSVLEPFTDKRGAGTPARMLNEDLDLAAGIVRNQKNLPGVNLLLYGAARLDKRQLLRSVIDKAGRSAWRVRSFDDAQHDDRAALVYLAQRLLKTKAPDAVLVVERTTDALADSRQSLLKVLFGIDLEPPESPFEEHLLATNPVPTVWLASSVAGLSDETVARFVFHAPLKKADRKDRLAQMQEMLDDFKLTRKAREEILKLDGVSVAQLESAMTAARLMGGRTRTERDAIVVQAIRRSQRALSRDVTAKLKRSVTQYSLDYLNTSGRFGPRDILECLKRRPHGSLVFYGLPGTGKAQFVEYMAGELGLPLVSKKASDLLSKWVGESEKNIAAAFEEAAAEDAILLLDEGDSFLRDRAMARESWQVSQVNEMLQHVERFEGIVVVCTNLFQGLDTAALRRFTFKLEFCELSAEQRWEMFQVESGVKGKLGTLAPGVRDDWYERLCFMRRLTAGDFATVKRQSEMLGLTLTPEEWLAQLKLECDLKRKDDGA